MLELRDLPETEAAAPAEWHCPDIDWPAVESFLTLVNVAGEALTAVDHYLGRHGMSRGRFMVLGVLARETPRAMCPSDLAAVCGVTRATITGLIDSLERDSMVTRQQSAGDHRMIHIRLTDEGRRFLDRVMPDYYRRVAQITVQLSPGEKAAMHAGLGKIKAGIGAMTAE
jgi:DNA-binding MarR family transcriptional regulator